MNTGRGYVRTSGKPDNIWNNLRAPTIGVRISFQNLYSQVTENKTWKILCPSKNTVIIHYNLILFEVQATVRINFPFIPAHFSFVCEFSVSYDSLNILLRRLRQTIKSALARAHTYTHTNTYFL